MKTIEEAHEWLYNHKNYITHSMKFTKEQLDEFTQVYKILTGVEKNMNCGSCFMNSKKELIKFIPDELVVKQIQIKKRPAKRRKSIFNNKT